MLKIAIFGYGQMGRILERIAPDHDCRVVKISDPNNEAYREPIDSESLKNVDICLDFSLPEAVITNVRKAGAAGKNIVIGTTGWYDDLPEVKKIAAEHGRGILYGGNFSFGMNLFFLMLKQSAGLISETNLYDVFGYELHHKKKADSPSGTARELAEIIKENFPAKKTAQFDRLQRKIEPDEFQIASIRGGSIPGTHVIGFDSPFDTIELKHTARTREGFAVGALKAAHWLKGKTGFFEFQKIFTDLLNER
jgi:4-hydroxy-tetrahydrodipicolinate reductase